jgi:hypothetical protein
MELVGIEFREFGSVLLLGHTEKRPVVVAVAKDSGTGEFFETTLDIPTFEEDG